MSNSVLDSLVSVFNVAIASAYPDLPFTQAAIIPSQPKQEKFGDYQVIQNANTVLDPNRPAKNETKRRDD